MVASVFKYQSDGRYVCLLLVSHRLNETITVFYIPMTLGEEMRNGTLGNKIWEPKEINKKEYQNLLFFPLHLSFRITS